MSTEQANSASWVTRKVRVDGIGKLELQSQLQRAGVQLNEAARVLFADARFTTSATGFLVDVVELPVASLGLGSGATFGRIVERAAAVGLGLCPLELGPSLRLQYADQPEGCVGYPASQHRAPPGSITVASAPLSDDEETPKGFYLRRIEGVLWLRAYRSWSGHVWSPEDVFVFSRSPNAV